ncbi:MAG: hypothetical protein WCJ88_12075 [Actinomycetes bacterium]
MKRTSFISRFRSLLAVAAILATSAVGAVAATPSAAQAISCNCVKSNLTLQGDAVGGLTQWINFNWVNDSPRIITNAQMSVTFPVGVDLDWASWDNQVYDPATRTLTATPTFWGSGSPTNTLEPWEESSPYFRVHFDESLVGTTVNIRMRASYIDQGIPGGILNGVSATVLERGEDFDYRAEATFTPDSTNWSGTTTFAAKVYNDGPGAGGTVYATIKIEEELTVLTPLPDGCVFDSTYWGYHRYSCTEYVPAGGSAVGLVASWSFTVQAPASSEWDWWDASLDLGCTTSGAAGSEDIDESNNDDSAVLTVPPSATGLLAVVRNLPTFIDQPGVITNPTAGREMSSSVDVFNAGDSTITGPITVTITPTAGFTPTSITATSEDNTAPAPSCVLATLTCTFSQLGDGLNGRIIIIGDLAPTILNGSEFSSSVTASATGFDSATDTDTTIISAIAEGIVTIDSVSHAKPGAQIDYGVTSTNGGPSTMFNPVVTLVLPAGMTVVHLPENCMQRGNTLTCNLGASLDPEEGYSFGFTVSLPDEVGDYQIVATLSSTTPLADTSVTGADHLVATATTVADLVDGSALPYTGTNTTWLALLGAGLALGGLILVTTTGRLATRRQSD